MTHAATNADINELFKHMTDDPDAVKYFGLVYENGGYDKVFSPCEELSHFSIEQIKEIASIISRYESGRVRLTFDNVTMEISPLAVFFYRQYKSQTSFAEFPSNLGVIVNYLYRQRLHRLIEEGAIILDRWELVESPEELKKCLILAITGAMVNAYIERDAIVRCYDEDEEWSLTKLKVTKNGNIWKSITNDD